MKKTIVIVGATGNLGSKIVESLLRLGADVKAIVRLESDENHVNSLIEKGVKVYRVDTENQSQIAECCIGADCFISAISGLEQAIIDAQKIFLGAAIAAKVPRFIPSDFSMDFTNLVLGQNRNLDFRRTFHRYLENAPIRSTTIFNGAFMDLLKGEMPLIMEKQKRILCWGNPDQIMEFTHTHDVAEFTAHVAVDDNTPRYLRIAGDRMSSNDFVKLLTDQTGNRFKLLRPGGIGLFNFVIKLARLFSPSKNELYPAWQGMQYMRDMMGGRVIFQNYDNARYPTMKWISIKDYLKS